MNQKLTKPSKNQELVKNLRSKIVQSEKDIGYYKDLYYKKSDETDKKQEIIETFQKLDERRITTREDGLNREVSNLKEIIKWLIKPSTTGGKKPEDYPHFGVDGIKP